MDFLPSSPSWTFPNFISFPQSTSQVWDSNFSSYIASYKRQCLLEQLSLHIQVCNYIVLQQLQLSLAVKYSSHFHFCLLKYTLRHQFEHYNLFFKVNSSLLQYCSATTCRRHNYIHWSFVCKFIEPSFSLPVSAALSALLRDDQQGQPRIPPETPSWQLR